MEFANACEEDEMSADKTTFAPFLVAGGDLATLLLVDRDMGSKFALFEARRWIGNGHDWASVARLVLAERLPELADVVRFDSEAGMFAAYGPRAAMMRLGAEMRDVYADDAALGDL